MQQCTTCKRTVKNCVNFPLSKFNGLLLSNGKFILYTYVKFTCVLNVCNHHYEIGEMYGENVVNSSLLFDKGCIKRKVFIPDRYSIEKCKILVDKGNKLNQLS